MTSRQKEILALVRKSAPVTGEQIAEQLGLSRPTIRSDLAVLIMLGLLDAKPKVGYFPGAAAQPQGEVRRMLLDLKVKDIQSRPVNIREASTVQDAVVAMFLENTGSIFVTDEQNWLQGIVSRKDLLKVILGNPGSAAMPVSLVMTRKANLVTVGPEEPALDAARMMIRHEVESLPVVVAVPDKSEIEVIGRVSNSTMTRILVDWAERIGRGE
ncbi:helix-turn-helix transcriptional regulator [Paenibacillus mesotrionivorans]|uniref:Helix-turn-helix transcriptional regulator n=1 Tax=Paenibacillus mesotrionivorans TaxID=3160968 RepID=A0ACC7NYN5_9BACL